MTPADLAVADVGPADYMGAAVIEGPVVSAQAWPDRLARRREFTGMLRSKSPA